MPNILIEKLEKGTNKTQKGNVYAGLKIEGVQLIDKHNLSEKPWSKFVYDFDEAIDLFDDFVEGDSIKITNERDGRFWKIVAVEHLDDVVREPAPEREPEQQALFPPEVSRKDIIIASEQAALEPVRVRLEALDIAIKHVDSLLSANEKYKQLFKATVTTEIVEDTVIATAEKFVDFLEGNIISSITSDSTDVEKEPAKLDEPQLPKD